MPHTADRAADRYDNLDRAVRRLAKRVGAPVVPRWETARYLALRDARDRAFVVEVARSGRELCTREMW